MVLSLVKSHRRFIKVVLLLLYIFNCCFRKHSLQRPKSFADFSVSSNLKLKFWKTDTYAKLREKKNYSRGCLQTFICRCIFRQRAELGSCSFNPKPSVKLHFPSGLVNHILPRPPPPPPPPQISPSLSPNSILSIFSSQLSKNHVWFCKFFCEIFVLFAKSLQKCLLILKYFTFFV
jgi:hypothetical protein